MITANCLLEAICVRTNVPDNGCPYNRPDMFQTVNLLQINCTVWQCYRETVKERRLRYAQEAATRREVEGS